MNDVITYPCQGFSDNLPTGKASGSLEIHQTNIHCIIDGQHFRMPLEGLQIEVGGASDRLVFLSHPSLPDWRFYTSDRSILKNPFLRQQQPLKQHLRKAQSIRLFNWLLLMVVTLAIIFLPLFFFTKVDNITKVIARKMPLKWEQQLGKTAYEQFITSAQQMDKEVSDKQLKPLIIHLEQALVDNPYHFEYTIINNAELNAFALPGGYIVIHSGLILAAESAEQLLGVIAHEIAHITEQHGIRNTIASAGAFAIVTALFGDVSGISGAIATATPLLINQTYSRDFEREADDLGHRLLVDANINPQGLIQFFDKILAKEKLAFANIEDNNIRDKVIDSTVFLRSHPTTQERIQRLQKMTPGRQQDFRNLDAPFDQLQQAVQQFVINNKPGEIDNASGH